MTNPDRTLIAIVLDRSGSMQRVRQATISAFNEFIDAQRGEPGEALVSLTLFNTGFENRHVASPIRHVHDLTDRTYVPAGMTALFDAVGTTIDKIGADLAARSESERPGKVIFVILTDGYENSSTEYSGDRVREMIKHQSEHYNWVFTYLGANQDAWANPFDIARGNTISYDNTDVGTRSAVATASAGVSAYRKGAGGQSATVYGDDAVDQREEKNRPA